MEIQHASYFEPTHIPQWNVQLRQVDREWHITLQDPLAKTETCVRMDIIAPPGITVAAHQATREAHWQRKRESRHHRSEPDLELQHDNTFLHGEQLPRQSGLYRGQGSYRYG